MEITRPGSLASSTRSGANFTGSVRREPLFEPAAPSAIGGSSVTFEPGARTFWHTHPAGQVLIVTDGSGWAQSWGEPRRDLRSGDVLRIDPYEKHWHGASDRTGMTHIAITESRDGSAVEWLEPVDDAQFMHPDWQQSDDGAEA